MLRDDTGGLLLRFVAGRPVRQITEDLLARACEGLAIEGQHALLLVCDNATWRPSRRVRSWIKGAQPPAKAEGGVRIVACYLSIKAQQLNAIEPIWVPGKRAMIEPERKLTAGEVVDRVCEYHGWERLEPISQQPARNRTRPAMPALRSSDHTDACGQ